MKFKLITQVIHLDRLSHVDSPNEASYAIVDSVVIQTEHHSADEVETAKAAFRETYDDLADRSRTRDFCIELKFTVLDIKGKQPPEMLRVGDALFDPSQIAAARRYCDTTGSAYGTLKGIYIFLKGDRVEDGAGHFIRMETEGAIEDALRDIATARKNLLKAG